MNNLKELKKLHCSIGDGDCIKCKLNSFCAYYKFVFPLEQQQTPKKVDIKISKKPVWDPRNFHCPNCSRKLKRDRSYQYCPKCGQKLDWSDKNE